MRKAMHSAAQYVIALSSTVMLIADLRSSDDMKLLTRPRRRHRTRIN